MISSMIRTARHGVGRRFLTTTPNQLVQLELDNGIARLTMQSPPVNALSLEMFQALSGAIHQAEADPSTQALVLQSGLPTIFSSGLDIMEMHNPETNRLVVFWKGFQQLFFDLYGSRLACIAGKVDVFALVCRALNNHRAHFCCGCHSH